jgi:ABC-type transport system involved in multi-copper enzyme maturation permease subunit
MNMSTALVNSVLRSVRVSWLTGPIFGKELRVSSRRRRNYALRFCYVALLSMFVVLVWANQVKYRGVGVFQVSRMASAAKTIVVTIAWFQFCATQLAAIVMLSTSISDEIYNRTLGLLMTTPIPSFQIVIGKLLSKLLQLILLLAISLPLLAVVRVLGGVPWGYVIYSLCMTLTAVIFVGSVSLFFSILSRRAYAVIIITVMTLGALFVLFPVLAAILLHRYVSEDAFFAVLSYLNPYVEFLSTSSTMFGGGRAGVSVLPCLPHCGIMLAASACVLFMSVRLVRKVALRQAAGQLSPFARLWRPREQNPVESFVLDKSPSGIRRVTGPPVIWKELISPLYRRHRLAVITVIGIEVILIFSTLLFPPIMEIVGYEVTNVLYVWLFLGLAMLFNIILPATCITFEKESRSWPLLLTTTLSDWQILLGKFVGVLRRCGPMWLLLLAYVVAFSCAKLIHPLAILHIVILAAGIVAFLSGSGLYFSSRSRGTTSAVIMNFALPAALWGLVPAVTVLAAAIMHEWQNFFEYCFNAVPFTQASVVMTHAATSVGTMDSYQWFDRRLSPVALTFLLSAFMLGYMLVGLLFAWRAKCRFRRNVF